MKSKRIKYALLFGALLIIEACIALFVRDAFVRPYVGDMLVTVLVCAFARIFIPRGGKFLPLYVFIFSALVETLQYLTAFYPSLSAEPSPLQISSAMQ